MTKMEELVKELNEAAKAYYSTDVQIMTDKEYDAKYAELEALEKETGIQLPDSPTLKVGYEVVSSLKKVTHEYPALSLDKTKDRESLPNWLNGKEGVLSWKCDGLTSQLTVENGKTSLVTRGNGIIGEDVSHNIPVIEGIPNLKNYSGKLVVRGETVINYDDFKAINATVDGKYMNPRNLAAGSLRLMDPNKAKGRKMKFVAFQLVYCSEGDYPLVSEAFDYLSSLGFNVVEHTIVNASNVVAAVGEFEKKIVGNPFPTDGLVITYNDIAYGQALGTTGKFPKHSLAFKWQDEAQETILRDIEWSASATGLLNPVAIFDPVELEGTIVKRASVHNIQWMNNLKLGIGDHIEVYKANMIIPQILCSKEESGNITVPDICPVCGGKTAREFNDDGSSEFLRCVNEDCPAKHLGKFTRLVERDALNVVGLAGSQIEDFLSRGWLCKRADIFSLSSHKEEIVEMEGYGQKSYQKLIDALEAAKNTTFKQFFYSLGIPGVGHDAAKILEKYFNGSYGDTINKTDVLRKIASSEDCIEKLSSLKGIGEVYAKSIRDWFENNIGEYDELLSVLNITDDSCVSSNNQKQDLDGVTFVITGSLNTYSNRDELKAEIEARGGKVAGSVSKNTNYLINNDSTSTSGKNKKAKELNIPIITEAEYKSL